MADNHDRYEVGTEYKVDDKSSEVVARIERGFKALYHQTERLHEKFHEFGRELRGNALAMLGVGFGLGALVEKGKEAVSSFERTKKSMAGLISETFNFPKGVEGIDKYNVASRMATEVTEELEKTVRDYGGTLDEAGQGYKQLSASVAPAHLTQKQLLDLYGKVAAAAKASGMDQASAADMIGRAIMTGQARPIGVLGKLMKEAFLSHGKLTKAMGMTGRLKLVEQVLGEQKPIADAMSQGMGDSFRRIQMDVEKMFRRVSGPVFKEVSKTIKSWAEGIEKAEKGARPLVDVIGDKLVKGFNVLKDVTGFLVDHWKTLAGIWATFKVGSMAGGVAGALSSVGGALGGNIGAAFSIFGKGLGNLAGAMGPVVAGLGLFKIALDALLGWVDAKIDKSREITTHGLTMAGAADTLQHLQKIGMGPLSEKQEKFGQNAVKELISSGALNPGGQLNRGGVMANVAHLDNAAKENLADALGIRVRGLPVSQMAAAQFADALAGKLEPILAAHPEFLPGAKKAETAANVDIDKLKTKGVQIGPFTGQININQKFDDVDPDRVWVATRRGIQESAERAVQSTYAGTFGE